MKILKSMIRVKGLGLGTRLVFITVVLFLITQANRAYTVVLDQNGSASVNASPSAVSAIPRRADHVPGEVLVKFKKGTTTATRKQFHAEVDAEVLSEVSRLEVERVKSRRGESTEALINRYKKNPQVEYAEPNGLFYTQLLPNEPRFPELWGLNNTGQTGGTPGADIRAPQAWDLQTGSNSVLVADIDTGVDYTHPDLAANMWTNPGEIPGDGIDNDHNGYIDDVRGWNFASNTNDPFDDYAHGTHTAGTIAAVGNNGLGVVGVNWRATIMPVKFITAFGYGTFEAAAASIIYAADRGAKISSNSWGCGGCFSQVAEDAIAYANSKGMLFVVAATNAYADNDLISPDRGYPCTSTQPNVICVLATDNNDQRASFSNWGAQSVHLGAPGVSILSTVPTGGCEYCDPTGYRLFSGTSMATPHVAGGAALLLAQFPSLTFDQVKNILMGSVDPIPALAGITVTGGRLNVNKALATKFVITGTPVIPTVLIGQSTTDTIHVTSLNGFSGAVTLSLTSPDPKITGSFSVNTVTLSPNGSSDSVLTVSTDPTLFRGTYLLRVTGTGPLGESYSARVTLQVPGPDFEMAMSAPSPDYIPIGGSTTYTVTVSSFVGYTTPVTLSLAPLDPNISGVFSPNPVAPPANGSATSTLTVTTTPSVSFGNHTLGIDGNDGVKTKTKSASLLVTDVDLVITAISGPTTGLTSGPIPISYTVCNQGTQGTGQAFYVNLYLSLDTIITAPKFSPPIVGDIQMTPADHVIGYPNGLAANTCQTVNTTVAIPGSVPPNTYYLGAIADDDSWGSTDNRGDILERDETNNSKVGNQITVTYGPDLVTTAVSGPTKAASGSSITVAYTVCSQGAVSATLYFSGIFLVDTVTNAKTLLQQVQDNVGPLFPGDCANRSWPVTLPQIAGKYFLQVVADYTDYVKESNETNNTMLGNQIAIGPDLVETAVSSGSTIRAATGSSISISDTVSNVGTGSAGSFSVGLYFTPSSGADILVGSRPVGSLAEGTSSSGNTPVTISTSVAPGSYTLKAIADFTSQVPESDESNNSVVGNPIGIFSAPTVVTNPASQISQTGATLNGSINPNFDATTGWFQWGLTTAYGNTTPAQALGSGTTVVAISQAITGLAVNTTYHFRAVGQNGAGPPVNGADQTLTTLALPPVVSTVSATNLTPTTATLNGTANPNGVTGTAWFEYGTSTSYGSTSTTQPISGSVANNVTIPIINLTSNTPYHYRIGAQNNGGTSYGTDATFTTLLSQDRLPTSNVSVSGAWSTVGCGGSKAYQCVDDPIGSPNNTTDYIRIQNSPGNGAIFGFSPFTIPSGVTIQFVRVTYVANVNIGSADIQAALRVSGTIYTQPMAQVLTTAWPTYSYNWAVNPSTGTAWTVAEVNGSALQGMGVVSGNGDESVTQVYVTVVYQFDTTPPTAPTNLTATPVNQVQINLSWTASTDNVGVTGYQVERCQGVSCSNFTLVATSTGTSYSDVGLLAGTSYSYRVQAKDTAGNLSGYSNVAMATTQSDTTPPTAPTNLTATPVNQVQINLSWTASTDNVGVTGYQVERCQGVSCSNFTLVATSTGTSYSDVGLLAGTSYSYRVRAFDAAGNQSSYSNTASATPSQSSNTWTTMSPMPTARRELAVGVVNGTLYAIGGRTGNSSTGLGTVEAYDPTTNTWTTKASMPTLRSRLAIGVINGILYAVGGRDTSGGALKTVEAYDPATNTWTTKAPMLTARDGLAVGVVNGILYAMGGYISTTSTLATVEAYNPSTNTWTTKASMPTGRYLFTTGVVNGILYAVGGYNGGTILATVAAYNPSTNSWTSKASMPTARYDLAGGVINGLLYAVGGQNSSNGNLATNEAYNPATNSWTTKASMPTGRSALGAGVVNGLLYAVGGQNTSNGSTTVEAYTP